MQAESVENVFARAWELLSRNPVILIPGLIIGLVFGVLQAVFAPAPIDINSDPNALAHATGSIGRNVIVAILGLIASTLNVAYTTGMAAALWQRGMTTLDDGAASFREDALRIILTFFMLAICYVITLIVGLGIGALVFGFFALYTLPAVIIRNFGPFAALAESFRVASKRWGPTLIVLVLIVVVGIVSGLISLPFRVIPYLGPVIASLINLAFSVFTTIVIVGEYLNLRGAIEPPTAVY